MLTAIESQIQGRIRHCIENCEAAHEQCVQAGIYVQKTYGGESEMDVLQVLQDCAAICSACTDFLLRDSGRAWMVCRVCAEIASICAERCEMFDGDAQMESCAEACFNCARTCMDAAGIQQSL